MWLDGAKMALFNTMMGGAHFHKFPDFHTVFLGYYILDWALLDENDPILFQKVLANK